MYEKYTKQALPEKKYRELLGSAICVFNSNNSFIIENILKLNIIDYNWYDLIDLESGKIKPKVEKIINDKEIYDLYSNLVEMRNRIVHSFQITYEGTQLLATKVRNSYEQFIITEKYLLDFIEMNEKLSSLLHDFRGY